MQKYRSSVSTSDLDLIFYYTFDSEATTATAFVDSVNHSSDYYLYVADHSSPVMSPTWDEYATPPVHNAPAEPIAARCLSTAAMCSTTGGDPQIRASKDLPVSITVDLLFCGATNPTVTVMAVRGGTVQQLGADVNGQPVAVSGTLEFTATVDPLPADAGFDYSVVDGGTTVNGKVVAKANSAPAFLASTVEVWGEEDMEFKGWIAVEDADNDFIQVEVFACFSVWQFATSLAGAPHLQVPRSHGLWATDPPCGPRSFISSLHQMVNRFTALMGLQKHFLGP